jgi:serine/threonine protein kinase
MDFGLSRSLGVSGFTTKTSSCTLRYQAPELLVGGCNQAALNPATTEGWRWMAPELIIGLTSVVTFTPATDVWAFSMTLIEVRVSTSAFW